MYHRCAGCVRSANHRVRAHQYASVLPQLIVREHEGDALLVASGGYLCTDDRAACGDGCFEVMSPRWACFESSEVHPKPGERPHWSTCMPSRTLCEKSRAPDADLKQGQCDDVTPVFCSRTEHHTLVCHSTGSECEQERGRIQDMANMATSKLHITMSPCFTLGT